MDHLDICDCKPYIIFLIILSITVLETEDVAVKDEELSLIAQLKTQLATPENQEAFEQLQQTAGDIAAPYMLFFALHENDTDKVYGIRKDSDNTFKIGSMSVLIEHYDLKIGDQWYERTAGLYELLFKKKPEPTSFNNNDKKIYLNIILQTNAHRRNFSASSQLNGSSIDEALGTW